MLQPDFVIQVWLISVWIIHKFWKKFCLGQESQKSWDKMWPRYAGIFHFCNIYFYLYGLRLLSAISLECSFFHWLDLLLRTQLRGNQIGVLYAGSSCRLKDLEYAVLMLFFSYHLSINQFFIIQLEYNIGILRVILFLVGYFIHHIG